MKLSSGLNFKALKSGTLAKAHHSHIVVLPNDPQTLLLFQLASMSNTIQHGVHFLAEFVWFRATLNEISSCLRASGQSLERQNELHNLVLIRRPGKAQAQ